MSQEKFNVYDCGCNLFHHICNEVELVSWAVGLLVTRFTGAFLDLDDSWQPLLQSLTAHHLQLTHVVVGSAIASTHPVAELALANPFAKTLAHGVLAVQALPAGWVFLAATGIAFSRSADKAAVAVIRDVATWAAGARALGDITARWTLAIGHKGLCKGLART